MLAMEKISIQRKEKKKRLTWMNSIPTKDWEVRNVARQYKVGERERERSCWQGLELTSQMIGLNRSLHDNMVLWLLVFQIKNVTKKFIIFSCLIQWTELYFLDASMISLWCEFWLDCGISSTLLACRLFSFLVISCKLQSILPSPVSLSMVFQLQWTSKFCFFFCIAFSVIFRGLSTLNLFSWWMPEWMTDGM